jgi:hypothetical protein
VEADDVVDDIEATLRRLEEAADAAQPPRRRRRSNPRAGIYGPNSTIGARILKRNSANAAAAAIHAASRFLGDDPHGKTDTVRLTELRRQFQEWLDNERQPAPQQHVDSDLRTRLDVRGGAKKAEQFYRSIGGQRVVKPRSVDTRLDTHNSYICWGLLPEHLVKRNGKQGPAFRQSLSHVEQLRYLAFAQPSCLEIPTNHERGDYFWHINESVLATADQADIWKKPLVWMLYSRVRSMMKVDVLRLICGSRALEQDAGRYVNQADIIRMWNNSVGKCPCGQSIYLGWQQDWDERHANNRDGIPAKRQAACVQRLNPDGIHLRENCADTLVCMSCDAHTNFNSASNVGTEPVMLE